MPLVALSDTGKRIGEGNGRAVALNVVVEAVLRDREAGLSWSELERRHHVPIRTMRHWVRGESRSTAPHSWKRVPEVRRPAPRTCCRLCGSKLEAHE